MVLSDKPPNEQNERTQAVRRVLLRGITFGFYMACLGYAFWALNSLTQNGFEWWLAHSHDLNVIMGVIVW
jgi:hypothetical protein